MTNETSDQITKKAEKVLTENLQFDPEEVNYQIDKCHRIRPINTQDGTQSTTVRFKTHSFREAVYLKRRKCNKKQKIKLSLTQRRRKTLAYAYNNADKLPEVDFFYTDIMKFFISYILYLLMYGSFPKFWK